MIVLKKVISGGQTGADQGGLFAAADAGLITGGYIGRGWKTEIGSGEAKLKRFGLIEIVSDDYPVRTKKNIEESDGTLLFSNGMSRGSQLTEKVCIKKDKPFLKLEPWLLSALFAAEQLDAEGKREGKIKVDTIIAQVFHWLIAYKIEVLNIAGSRESKSPGIFDLTYKFLLRAFVKIKKDGGLCVH